MKKDLYDKLKFVPIIIIIVSIYIIGVNLVNGFEADYQSKETSGDNAAYTASETEPADFIVNINSAGYNELQELPGVGKVTAERILEYRVDTGGFKNVNELMLIKGISAAKYEKLLPYVTVDGNNE